MSARKSRILVDAEFDPKVIKYEVVSTAVALLCTVILVPLLPIVLPFVYWYMTRYYRSLRVTLTSRDLVVAGGIWTRSEASIPLEKITDLAVVQGPIMRRYGVMLMRVETAGQTGGPGGGLVNITGIVDCREFRDQVLAQRDRIADHDASTSSSTPVAPPVAAATTSTDPAAAPIGGANTERLLTEIRDLLVRIERRMSDTP